MTNALSTRQDRINSLVSQWLPRALVVAQHAWDAYDREVEEWYAEGDGRPARWIEDSDHPGYQINVGGVGHTFPACRHGYSRWTDYDNICPGCEGGESVQDVALGIATATAVRFTDTMDWVQSAPVGLLPDDMRQDFILKAWLAAESTLTVPA